MYFYDLSNTTVLVKPAGNGKQSDVIPNLVSNSRIQCEADKDAVDEFLSERRKIEVKSDKRQMSAMGWGAVAGALVGLAVKGAESAAARSVYGAAVGLCAGILAGLRIAYKSEIAKENLSEKFVSKNAVQD